MTKLLPAITATRAARIRAAHDRHPNNTAAVIIMTAYTSSNTAAAAEVANAAHAAAYLAIRAREQASGLDLMRQLAQQQQSDRRREDIPRIAAEAAAHHAAHAAHRAQAEALQTIADRATTSAEDSRRAAVEAVKERAAAARELAAAAQLETYISESSHSDRADISQAAAAVLWETGNFPAACKAAGKAIAAVAAAKGATNTRTKVFPITAEEARAELKAHPNTDRIPFNVKGGNSSTQGFYTIEHRDSKRFPRGWYRVNHYYTTAPYISYETFATDEDAPALATNGGINAIYDAQTAADIADLFNRANLSERERTICKYMTDNTAAAAGIAAVAAHQQRTAERIAAAADRKSAQRIQRESDRQTEDIRAKAQRVNAMTRAGIYSDAAQRKALERIRAKLDCARTAPAEPTAAELDERTRRNWEHLQSNRSRYTRTTAAAPAPAIVPALTIAADTAADMKPTEYATMTVEFVQTINPADLRPVTAEEETARRAAWQQERNSRAADAARIEYRRQYSSTHRARTAYAAHDAQDVALFYWDSMTRAEQLAIIADVRAAEAAAAAQSAAAALAKAESKRNVYALRSRAAELAALAAAAPKHRREELTEAATAAHRAAERAAEAAKTDSREEAAKAAHLAQTAAMLAAAAKEDRTA